MNTRIANGNGGGHLPSLPASLGMKPNGVHVTNPSTNGGLNGAAPALEPAAAKPEEPASARRLHRLGDARKQEGISRRTIARRLGITVREVKDLELPTADMKVSTLRRWQEVLRVPISELLEDTDSGLSPPVELRARLLRIMKTATTILQRSKQVSVRRLAQRLVDQLVETMPELRDISSWPIVGKRRQSNELGITAQREFRGRCTEAGS